MSVQFADVSLQIGSRHIADCFNLTMKAGEVWGILGPNGCGKSSLLHSIVNLRSLNAGNILIDNTVNTKLKLAKFVGILLQEMATLFEQRVWEYCLSARFPHLSYFQQYSAEDLRNIENVLRLLGLWELRHRTLPSLSGGEKKRVAIASLLIQQPKIYLLDEPANHLDIKYQQIVFQQFLSLAREDSALVVMALHDVNQAQRYCDKIMLMFPKGRIISGDTREVLNTQHLSELYQHGFECHRLKDHVYWQCVA